MSSYTTKNESNTLIFIITIMIGVFLLISLTVSNHKVIKKQEKEKLYKIVTLNTHSIKKKPPVIKKKPPVIKKKPPVIKKKPPVINNKQPVVNKKPPVINNKTPVVNNKTPVVNKKPPVINKKPPMVNNKTPVVNKKELVLEPVEVKNTDADKLALMLASMSNPVVIKKSNPLNANSMSEKYKKRSQYEKVINKKRKIYSIKGNENIDRDISKIINTSKRNRKKIKLVITKTRKTVLLSNKINDDISDAVNKLLFTLRKDIQKIISSENLTNVTLNLKLNVYEGRIVECSIGNNYEKVSKRLRKLLIGKYIEVKLSGVNTTVIYVK